MRHLILPAALFACGALALVDVTRAHGGSYRGPGDTVPPGGTGTGTGGTGPSIPTGSTPSTGSTSGPSQPSQPTTGVSTGGARAASGIATGPGLGGTDLTTWEFWWGFNKDAYLNLKAHIHGGGVSTGDDFFSRLGGRDGAKDTLKPSQETIRAKVVPALLEVLEKERSNDIVTGALVALGKIGDERREDGSSAFEPVIARFLADPTQEIAETAAIALGILANEAAVPTLEHLAHDTREGRGLVGTTEVRYRNRAFALYGLGLIGARTNRNEVRQEIVRSLVDLLRKPDTSTRDVKVAAVIALGLVPLDVDPSEEPQGTTDPSASRQAELRFLRRYYQDQDNHHLIRAHAPRAMARLLDGAPAESREAVARLLLAGVAPNSKEKAEVRQSCVLALGQIGDTDADELDRDIRAALQRAADDADIQTRNFACIAMGQVGGRPGPGADNDAGREEARRFLLAQLKGRSHARSWGAIGLGVMEHALNEQGLTASSASVLVRGELRRALEDASAPDRLGACAIALGIAGAVDCRDALLAKLSATSEQALRGYVALGLGLLGANEAVEPIRAIVRESKYKPDLLKSAAIGLGLLGDKDLVPELCGMLAEAKGLSSQAAIASALGFIGDSRSVDPLVAMLKRKEGISDTARGFAAVALGIVADKEELPWNAKVSRDINYRANTLTLTGENGTGILDIL